MGSSVTSIRTKVRRLVHQTASNTSMWSDDLINDRINSCYRRRWAELDRAHEGRFVKRITIPVEEDKEIYDFGDDFYSTTLLRLLKLEYETTDLTRIPIHRDERHDNAINPTNYYAYECPYTYRPVEGGIAIEPIPQSATGALRLEYVETPTDLGSSGSFSDDFPALFDELIIWDVVVELLASEGQLEDGSPKAAMTEMLRWERLWKEYIKTLIVSRDNIEQFPGWYADA